VAQFGESNNITENWLLLEENESEVRRRVSFHFGFRQSNKMCGWLKSILTLPVSSGQFLYCEFDVLKNSSSAKFFTPSNTSFCPLLQDNKN
jgi:hypothetical protein